MNLANTPNAIGFVDVWRAVNGMAVGATVWWPNPMENGDEDSGYTRYSGLFISLNFFKGT